MSTPIPRIIWTLWLQGWDNSPEIASASLASWRGSNPRWQINALDSNSLTNFIPEPDLSRIFGAVATPEAVSDLIRFELLHRYGGVWADATTICARPLDEWLPAAVGPSGFFAFAKPSPARPLATWFLAAAVGCHIMRAWRDAAALYWSSRTERHNYFWPHYLFGQCCDTDPTFGDAWARTPQITARHSFHFAPNAPVLYLPPTAPDLDGVQNPVAPVFKLTHKLARPYDQQSLMGVLCRFGFSRSARTATAMPAGRKRLLVGWYGAFPGHGTIGDLRAAEVLVSHLVASGHEVVHATSSDTTAVVGAIRVDWKTIDPATIDAVLFVCGPIIKGHPKTAEFFNYFKTRPLVGVAVSMFPRDHPSYFMPFEKVFAREGMPESFGDLAVAAPVPISSRKATGSPTQIGVSLRGRQDEYGAAICRWRETENLAKIIAGYALEKTEGFIVEIENHLARAQLEPMEIESQYANSNLVITSRFHGAMEAMRFGVPFIAIDQIEGGAKIIQLLFGLGWPHVYRIEHADGLALGEIAKKFMRDEGSSSIYRAREAAIRMANQTLTALDDWLDALAVR